MRVAPNAKAIRRAKLSHGGLKPAHAVCVVFQKNYHLAIHSARAEQCGFADVAGFDAFRHSSFAMHIASQLLLPCPFLP